MHADLSMTESDRLDFLDDFALTLATAVLSSYMALHGPLPPADEPTVRAAADMLRLAEEAGHHCSKLSPPVEPSTVGPYMS